MILNRKMSYKPKSGERERGGGGGSQGRDPIFKYLRISDIQSLHVHDAVTLGGKGGTCL